MQIIFPEPSQHTNSSSALFVRIKVFLVQSLRLSHLAGPRLADLNPARSFLLYASIPFCWAATNDPKSWKQIHTTVNLSDRVISRAETTRLLGLKLGPPGSGGVIDGGSYFLCGDSSVKPASESP